jgi:hypothetical protein
MPSRKKVPKKPHFLIEVIHKLGAADPDTIDRQEDRDECQDAFYRDVFLEGSAQLEPRLSSNNLKN